MPQYVSINADKATFDRLYAALDAIPALARERMKVLTEEISVTASGHLLALQPRRKTGDLSRRISRTPLTYLPGGVGGGGSYGSIVGIKHGTDAHPLWVEEGTGIYGPRRRRIFPAHGKTMRIPSDWADANLPVGRSRIDGIIRSRKRGEGIRVQSYKGQRPQHYFARTWALTQVTAEARVRSFNFFPR